MTKIEQIKDAIVKAERRESKLTPLALSVPALSSLNIRHLMNNLGAISRSYLECGVHKGGLFASTICNNNNLKYVCAVDSWSSDNKNDDKAEPQFDDNVSMIIPSDTRLIKIKSECFSTTWESLPGNYDLYLYDAGHSLEEQKKALTYEAYHYHLDKEIIFCVDDYDWPEVKNGTRQGIEEGGFDVLFSKTFEGNNHDNEGWWNGFAVFLLKKKQ